MFFETQQIYKTKYFGNIEYLFQPTTFDNLNHELVFQIGAHILLVISFTFSALVGLYYSNTNKGTTKMLALIKIIPSLIIFQTMSQLLLPIILDRIKSSTVNIPSVFLTYITVACMLTSEIVAKRRKRKLQPTDNNNDSVNPGKNLVISKLIPFQDSI